MYFATFLEVNCSEEVIDALTVSEIMHLMWFTLGNPSACLFDGHGKNRTFPQF